MDEPKSPRNPNELNKWKLANFALELGFIIALPLVALAFLGKWLDGKWGTEPWVTIVGVLLAIISTTVWLVRRFKEIIK